MPSDATEVITEQLQVLRSRELQDEGTDLRRHRRARHNAVTARFCAALAVIVVVGFALLGTPPALSEQVPSPERTPLNADRRIGGSRQARERDQARAELCSEDDLERIPSQSAPSQRALRKHDWTMGVVGSIGSIGSIGFVRIRSDSFGSV